MRWRRGPVSAARTRGGRTRGKRDIRPSVSACREPRTHTRHWRVLAETLRFLAPCATVFRGPESYTSSDDSSPHPVPWPAGVPPGCSLIVKLPSRPRGPTPTVAGWMAEFLGSCPEGLGAGEEACTCPQRKIRDLCDPECFLFS